MKIHKTNSLHNLTETRYLTDTGTSLCLFSGSASENMQCTGSLSYFIYGLASLVVMVSNIATQRCLICHTAGSVPVVASDEGTCMPSPQLFPFIAL